MSQRTDSPYTGFGGGQRGNVIAVLAVVAGLMIFAVVILYVIEF